MIVPVILASASPRRRELLTLIGIAHEVVPANVDETLLAGEIPRAYAERLARAKAQSVAAPGKLSIGSDTIVVVDGDVLGKPRDENEAAAMLRRLSGRSHTVMTAIAIAFAGGVTADVIQVGVTFRALREDEIQDYIRTGEPMDKAGAYGIQGFGATIVDAVAGDYFAVMGLPLNRMVRLLESAGLTYRFGEATITDSGRARAEPSRERR
ncbi:MAG: Maf family protein [Gemmatimonadaceae bacterium]